MFVASTFAALYIYWQLLEPIKLIQSMYMVNQWIPRFLSPLVPNTLVYGGVFLASVPYVTFWLWIAVLLKPVWKYTFFASFKTFYNAFEGLVSTQVMYFIIFLI